MTRPGARALITSSRSPTVPDAGTSTPSTAPSESVIEKSGIPAAFVRRPRPPLRSESRVLALRSKLAPTAEEMSMPSVNRRSP